MEPRTIGCIHLGHVPSKQGGHELLHLHTGDYITRPRVTVIPIPDDVIDRVEALAAEQGMRGLEIADRNRVVYDHGVPEGVDNDEDDEDPPPGVTHDQDDDEDDPSFAADRDHERSTTIVMAMTMMRTLTMKTCLILSRMMNLMIPTTILW